MAEAKTLQKVKKKKWYAMCARMFNNAALGETFAAEESKLLGRVVSVNLASLSGDIKRQSVSLRFKISSVKEGNAYADVISYVTSANAIKRLVRRGVERFDISFTAETSDHVKVRIKTIVLTRSKTSSSVLKALRKACTESIAKETSNMSYEQLISALIEHRLQSELRKSLSKIYPLKAFEIKVLHVLHEKEEAKAAEPKEEAKAAEPKEEAKAAELGANVVESETESEK